MPGTGSPNSSSTVPPRDVDFGSSSIASPTCWESRSVSGTDDAVKPGAVAERLNEPDGKSYRTNSPAASQSTLFENPATGPMALVAGFGGAGVPRGPVAIGEGGASMSETVGYATGRPAVSATRPRMNAVPDRIGRGGALSAATVGGCPRAGARCAARPHTTPTAATAPSATRRRINAPS